jgi:hypothetical protein
MDWFITIILLSISTAMIILFRKVWKERGNN